VAFTDTFENLHGLTQLPGIAIQRLMASGYGFGAEGDWKTAALVRAMKVMAAGLEGGTSFMEDYTYHFHPSVSKVLGAHMLEICESVAAKKPSCEIHPLGIGGKEDPVRLVFDSQTGPAVNATVIDMGNRFRMVVNTVDVVRPDRPCRSSPLRVPCGSLSRTWRPPRRPGFSPAGPTTPGSRSPSPRASGGLCRDGGIEFLLIDEETKLRGFKKELRLGEIYYHLARAFEDRPCSAARLLPLVGAFARG